MNVGVHVSPEVAAGWPDYRVAVVIAEGIANGPSDAASEGLLAAAEQSARELGVERAADDPRIAAWRSAFPSSARSRAATRRLPKRCWRACSSRRRWNWRQEPGTRLTEQTRNAFFVFDDLPPQQSLDAAVQELVGHLRERSPGVRTRVISAPSE